MDIVQSLEKLSGLTAVAGFERATANDIKQMLQGLCDKVEIDKFFNVVATKKGSSATAKKIMITAHTDEIGLMVSSINENGFVGVSNIGGIDSKVLLAQEVTIHGKSDIYGIIGAMPPHLMKPEDAGKAVKISELYVDTGIRDVSLKDKVAIGDIISIKSNFCCLQNSKVSGKTMDNRVGVCCLIEILNELKSIKHENDIIILASTQEETYLTGVTTASYALRPDAAFVIDATHGDIPDAPKERTSQLGKGPEISIGPNLHPKMVNKCFEIAKENCIPFQKMVESGDTGTEAWATQVSAYGIPTVLISVPVRYMHTPVETASIKDIKYTARIITEFLKMGSAELDSVLNLF
jgi:endoglucanase